MLYLYERVPKVDVDMVDEDMVNRKFLVNFIYLGSLPRIISWTCLDSLVLLRASISEYLVKPLRKIFTRGSDPFGHVYYLYY